MTVNELIRELEKFVGRGWGDHVILHSPKWAKVVEVTEINGPYTVVKSNTDNWSQLGSIPFFDDDDDDEKRKEWNKNHTIKSGLVLE